MNGADNQLQVILPQLAEEMASGGTSHEEILEKLKRVVKHYMEHRFAELLNICYRMDIREKDVDGAFAKSSINEVAEALTLLMMDRQREKILSRKNYKA